MNDTAEFLQTQYDQAVHQYGENSLEALQAEREAIEFFRGKPAPVTPVVQQEYSNGFCGI